MTTNLDIANQALQIMGSRTNMASLAEQSNEAIQCNLIMFRLRDELNRMAPWNSMSKRANTVYVSSVPGTPENSTTAAPAMWVPGIPAPPWAYEYQYPVDCLRVRSIIPQYTTQAGGVPIYPMGIVTGTTFVGWMGPALKFEVGIDTFFGVSAAAVATGGTGYAIGDVITLAQPNFTFTQAGQSFTMPVGGPAQLLVTGAAGGAITSVSVVNQVQGETSAIGGSYFSTQNPNGVGQGLTTGAGTGATFNLTFITPAAPQRIILCNQELPIIEYNAQITDPNVMDPLFQDAWASILAARLAFQLSGDKAMANQCIATANNLIMEARKADGNEGITVNDVTPDFIRIRGDWGGPYWEYSPNMSFDWGSFYSPY